MVLAVAEGRLHRPTPSHGPAVGLSVLAREGDRGGVGMELLQSDVKLRDEGEDEFGKQRRAIEIEEANALGMEVIVMAFPLEHQAQRAATSSCRGYETYCPCQAGA